MKKGAFWKRLKVFITLKKIQSYLSQEFLSRTWLELVNTSSVRIVYGRQDRYPQFLQQQKKQLSLSSHCNPDINL